MSDAQGKLSQNFKIDISKKDLDLNPKTAEGYVDTEYNSQNANSIGQELNSEEVFHDVDVEGQDPDSDDEREPPELQWSSDEETEEVGLNENDMGDESDSDDEFPLLSQWIHDKLIEDTINNDQEPDRANEDSVHNGENSVTPMNIINHDQNDPVDFEKNLDLNSDDMVNFMNMICNWWLT